MAIKSAADVLADQHTLEKTTCAVVCNFQARLPNMKRGERRLCLYLAGSSWKGHKVNFDTQTCTYIPSHMHTHAKPNINTHTLNQSTQRETNSSLK